MDKEIRRKIYLAIMEVRHCPIDYLHFDILRDVSFSVLSRQIDYMIEKGRIEKFFILDRTFYRIAKSEKEATNG